MIHFEDQRKVRLADIFSEFDETARHLMQDREDLSIVDADCSSPSVESGEAVK